MARRQPQPQPPAPTGAELAILRVLWDAGPATVRQVHERLPAGRTVGYTTVLKLLQVMAGKKLVRRDERQRSHVYRAAAPADATLGRLVRDLLDRAFGGSARSLVMHVLDAKRASPEELREIRALLDQMEERP
ncbi:MAG: Transcriptional repressor, BlaI/MecI family [Phycisphaerales bacterium]|nr:Transcriptional repressor, BlaI/MecI family [Phycisphaerales bacterium]